MGSWQGVSIRNRANQASAMDLQVWAMQQLKDTERLCSDTQRYGEMKFEGGAIEVGGSGAECGATRST